MSTQERQLQEACPKCGKTTVTCKFILSGAMSPYYYTYIHECSCGYRQEETDTIHASDIHGARCPFCRHAWTSDSEAEFWLDDSID